MMKKMVRYGLAVILCLVTAAYGYGQSAVDGAISGTVADNTSAAVPGAKVVRD